MVVVGEDVEVVWDDFDLDGMYFAGCASSEGFEVGGVEDDGAFDVFSRNCSIVGVVVVVGNYIVSNFYGWLEVGMRNSIEYSIGYF